jgi:UDP-N-acetylenolpyruvoylglucosamine reductase
MWRYTYNLQGLYETPAAAGAATGEPQRAGEIINVMAEARRRAHEQYGIVLEHEVEFLGPLEPPPL